MKVRTLRTLIPLVLAVSCSLGRLPAQEPQATAWPPVIARKLPPAGKPISDEARSRLVSKLKQLGEKLYVQEGRPAEASEEQVNDIAALLKAVDYALQNGEFFDPKKDVDKADAVLKVAEQRIGALSDDKAKNSLVGVSLRGFRSQIDDSIQPYGLIVPEGLDTSKPVPLYVWLHGRGDTQCDLQFCYAFSGTKAPGPFQLKDAVILHPFGRYCNGWKSAGEIDVFEAIDDVKDRLKIDENRIVLAGFSMGGAGAWHMGAHYADYWCAVHAGAGFVDVRRYQNVTPDKMPPWYEQKLWGLYDVPDYRRNFLNVPIIAYSGEEDKQKASADIMEAELAEEGLKLPHFIGPKMGHKYHPDVLIEVQKKIAEAVAKGRDESPRKISLQTKTLRYNRMFWAEIWGLERHWDDSRLDIDWTDDNRLLVSTKNVTHFKLQFPLSDVQLPSPAIRVTIDGKELADAGGAPFHHLFYKSGDAWMSKPYSKDAVESMFAGRKRPGLQGPIDDAFMSRFESVPPSGDDNSLVGRWAKFESQHLADRWRLLMRGEAPTPAPGAKDEPADQNIVLWGTPKSNPAIAAIVDKLPIKWTDKTVGMGDLEFDATKVVPVLIYPNPKNPKQYVVINSGLTFREAHDRTNSLQNPKLGDWAFIDVTTPPNDEAPGKVLAAGFFDENWRYVPQKK